MNDSPYESGRAAFQSGQPLTANPYFGNTLAWEAWDRGWKAAQWAAKVHRSADEAEESRERAARIIKAEDAEGGR